MYLNQCRIFKQYNRMQYYKPRFRVAVNNAFGIALCIECSLHAVQEVPGSIPDWDASVSDALCRGCRWPWSIPYIVVTPMWYNCHADLRFKRPAPSHAPEVRAPCSHSRYSDLHASDQIYPHPSQTKPRSPIKSLRHRSLGGSCSSTSRGSEKQSITPLEWLFA